MTDSKDSNVKMVLDHKTLQAIFAYNSMLFPNDYTFGKFIGAGLKKAIHSRYEEIQENLEEYDNKIIIPLLSIIDFKFISEYFSKFRDDKNYKMPETHLLTNACSGIGGGFAADVPAEIIKILKSQDVVSPRTFIEISNILKEDFKGLPKFLKPDEVQLHIKQGLGLLRDLNTVLTELLPTLLEDGVLEEIASTISNVVSGYINLVPDLTNIIGEYQHSFPKKHPKTAAKILPAALRLKKGFKELEVKE